jgi:cytoskeletal protein RodZ
MSATGVLQAATVISLTDQTAIGGEIGTENVEYLHLYLTYAKGDETGVTIRMFARRTTGGTDYQSKVWTESSGVTTANDEEIYLTASGSYLFEWELGAVDFVYFTQAGTNDGTPTGTLAASYSLSTE